jgi:hypothetical protein
MFYIKFEITEEEKYQAFRKLFDHMVVVRNPGYKEPETFIAWESFTDEDFENLVDPDMQKLKLYYQLVPSYSYEFR